MGVIRTHNITLYDNCGAQSLTLRPLADGHLPLLYRWCADEEVMRLADEGGTVCDAETARTLYGRVSQTAHCFLIEADGVPVGECWLQRMDVSSVRSMYPAGVDVRRIDICIGEKAYWGRGIGTAAVRMLVKFAFEREGTDVLHCLCAEENVRSCRLWERCGFSLIDREGMRNDGGKTYRCHYRLRRWEYG